MLLMRRAILGGTFDPPHWGHLMIAEVAYHTLGVEKIWFLPTGSPWQKEAEESVTEPELRVKMLRLAIAGIPYFELSTLEVERSGPTYTVETLEALADEEAVWLVMGADTASQLTSWNRWEEVREKARAAVAPREGVPQEAVEQIWGDRVQWLDAPNLSISSTELRTRVRQHQSIRYLVPEAVRIFVYTHGLYQR